MKLRKEKILIVDDNIDLLQVVTFALERADYDPLTATDGLAGLEMFHQHHPDLVILDIMMPGIDGWEVCRRLREISDVPIIMLTILGQEQEVVRGLKTGADDYVAKPFSTQELLGRIEAALRRVKMVRTRTKDQEHTVGDLMLVPATRQVVVKGKTINLTPTEFNLLAALARHAGKIVPHRQLLQEVWGQDHNIDVSQLKVYVYYLRQKIEQDPRQPRYILSERGRGYWLAT